MEETFIRWKIGCFIFILSMGILLCQTKSTIALLELDASGISKNDAAVLSDRLQSELINTKKYQVMERAKVSEILDEQGFQMSGCTSTECAVEIGKLVGVEQMVAGNIGKLGEIYTINIRLIDVRTGEVLKTAIVDRRCSIEVVLTECMKEAALQISGESAVPREKVSLEEPPKKQSQPTQRSPRTRYTQNRSFSRDRSLLLGAGWGAGHYRIPENVSGENNVIAASLKNLFNLLIAFNLSDNFRVNFSYFHSKLEGTGILYSFEGTMKTYYPRMSFFPWNWVYFSYGYAFSTLNLDFSPLNQVGLNPVSHSHSESKMALAVGLDFKLLERFHFIFDYNIIKDYNQSVFTIALAL